MASNRNPISQTLDKDTSHGQVSLYINKNHILSATYLKKGIPFYRFVQAPPVMLRPFHIPMDLKIGGDRTDQEQEKSILYRAQDSNDEKELAIVRVSVRTLSNDDFKTVVLINEEMATGRERKDQCGVTQEEQLSFDDRKKNWIIRYLPRSKGNKMDAFYVHLQTDIQFRSLIDAYKFIVHGRHPPPHRARKGTSNNTSHLYYYTNLLQSSSRRERGDKLLNRVKVGCYNYTKNEIMRTQTCQAESSSNNSSPMGTGRTKRKRVEEMPAPIGEGLTGFGPSSEDRYYALYDFLPVQQPE